MQKNDTRTLLKRPTWVTAAIVMSILALFVGVPIVITSKFAAPLRETVVDVMDFYSGFAKGFVQGLQMKICPNIPVVPFSELCSNCTALCNSSESKASSIKTDDQSISSAN